MADTNNWSNRRKETRVDANHIIRWKRPGKVEDHKAWMVDRSPSGLGFMTTADVAPRPGEPLHVRRLEDDRWATIERPIRVARADPTSQDGLVMIGCRLE